VTSESSELKDLLIQRAAEEDARRHRVGFAFKSYEAFVLAHGRTYESAPLTDREREHVQRLLDAHRACWPRGFEYNHCFVNSQELMSRDKTGKVVYVEGYVWAYGDRLPPVHHGWLTLHGKVIDMTVVTRAIARPDRLPPEPLQVHGELQERAYFGVPFLRSHFKFRRSLNRGRGSLLDDAEAGYPLLKLGADGALRRAR